MLKIAVRCSEAVACAFALALLACQAAAAQPMSGDVYPTDSGPLTIHPVHHASFVMTWDGKTIYNDPVGGAAPFEGLPRPDLILISHGHSDHLDVATLHALVQADTKLVAPSAVADKLPQDLRSRTTVLANGDRTVLMGVDIQAVPAYNTTPGRLKYHPKGVGNGYVLTMGGKRIYISGDTEDIPAMRALKNIDIAFICFNLPYTMTEEQAASAVRAFAPKIVYPYHYRGSDLAKFEKLLGRDKGIEVRTGHWY